MPRDDTIEDDDVDNNNKESASASTVRTAAGDPLRRAAAWLGGSGVALGAWGAHALPHHRFGGNNNNNNNNNQRRMDQWKTAVMYQLVHAVAVLAVAALCDSVVVAGAAAVPRVVDAPPPPPTTSPSSSSGPGTVKRYQRAGQCMALGSLLFSGSIYLLCLDMGPKKLLGPTTPIGGLFLMAGWAMLFGAS